MSSLSYISTPGGAAIMVRFGKVRECGLWFVVLLALAAGCAPPETAGVSVERRAVTSPTFVQGTFAVPQTPQTTVTVAFGAAQTAGDLAVVVVGWNDTTSTVTSVTDTRGNAYQL